MWNIKKVRIFKEETTKYPIETEVNDFLATLSYGDVLEIKPYGNEADGINVVYRETVQG